MKASAPCLRAEPAVEVVLAMMHALMQASAPCVKTESVEGVLERAR